MFVINRNSGLVAALLLPILGGCAAYGPNHQHSAAMLPFAAAEPASAASKVSRIPEAGNVPTWRQHLPVSSLPLSPGDALRIDIANGDGFSGRYEVDVDGKVKLPHIDAIAAAGLSADDVAEAIAHALVEEEYFREESVRVAVAVVEWSHVQVHVAGAVFNPGTVSINVRSPEERQLSVNDQSGDFPSERMLSSALKAAGGVTPNASVERIEVERGARSFVVDYSAVFSGGEILKFPLISGDRVTVHSSGIFDDGLVKPSLITAPGIRIFLSNLTVPAAGNALSAVGRDATSMPYGSRLLTGAVSANCVGGIRSTSGPRHVVLVRNNVVTARQEVIERSIEGLLDDPNDSELNPYLMPNDTISCFDSGVTNFRDILKIIAEIVTPFGLLL